MKRNLLALTVFVALAGLTYVQFQLLVVGAKLEKQGFDQRLAIAQHTIREGLNRPEVLSDALIARLKRQDTTPPQPDYLLDSLQHFLESEMAKAGISPRFAFAITPRYSEDVLLASPNFRADDFTFGKYSILLDDYFLGQLFTERVLHLDIENLFGYLLGELDYLVLPSALCLLAIIVCLGLLLNILRKEERLNVVKNDFINNLTHELKTPAFGISLATKLARDSLGKDKPEKTLEYLQIIEKEKDKLVAHAEKVLELASLESGQQHFQKEKTDLHELIIAVAENFRPQVEAKGGKLTVNLEATSHELLVDRSHFNNVLQNLLDNALKYSPEAPFIEVVTRSVGSHFELSVRDEGMGISPSDQRRIFDKFFRATTGNLHEVKGFGLGLSYVWQVVRAHDGKVVVESRVGAGSVLRIVLPL